MSKNEQEQEVETLRQRLLAAYEMLLSAARSLEWEGDVASYDEIFAFLRKSREGQSVIDAYLHGSQEPAP